jgi:ketosteroid isomerase-like protein
MGDRFASPPELAYPAAAPQNAFYGGGDDQQLRALLDPDITWTVPVSSPIAGSYKESMRFRLLHLPTRPGRRHVPHA